MKPILIFLAAMLLLGGCSRTVYVPAESVTARTDTVMQTRWRTDWRVEKDSVLVVVKGDSVVVRDTKWRTREVTKTDTVYLSKADSVYVEKPVTVEVVREAKQPWWNRMWVGIAAGLLPLAITTIFLLKKAKNYKF